MNAFKSNKGNIAVWIGVSLVIVVLLIMAILKLHVININVNNSGDPSVSSYNPTPGDYNNPNIGVRLQYPTDWQAHTNYTSSSIIQAQFSKDQDADFRVLIPQIVTVDLQQAVKQYKDINTQNYGNLSYEEDMDTTINGVQFHKLTWNANLQDQAKTPIKTTALIAIVNGKEYQFAANVKSSMYNQLLPQINSITSSIVIR